MRKPFLAVAIVVALMVVAATVSEKACSGSKRATVPATTPPAGSTPAVPSAVTAASDAPTQQQLYDDIRRKGLTPERALQLFSMVMGPLPGVRVPAGGRDPHDFCGTPAVGYLYQVWSSLTHDQREAATKIIEGSTALRAASGGTRPTLASMSFLPGPTSVVNRLLPTTPLFDYKTVAQNANGTLAAYLGVPPVRFAMNIDFGPPPPGTAKAETILWDGAGNEWPEGCHIKVWDQRFVGFTYADAASVMTHEMFHCYQDRQAGNAADWYTVRRWVVEGEPMWAMASVQPDATIYAKDWNEYISHPEKVAFDRGQDAIGVFGHLGDVAGGDAAVWAKLLPVVTAGVGGGDWVPFNLLIQGNADSYYSSWGASYFESPLGYLWNTNGPGHPPTSGPPPDSKSIDPGTTAFAFVPHLQADLSKLTGTADIVKVSLLSGYGRLHDEPFTVDTELSTSGPLALCLKPGGCKCPEGSFGAPLKTDPATAPLFVGLDGGDTGFLEGARTTFQGFSLDDFCKKPDRTPPPVLGAGPANGGGGAGGDDGSDNKKPDALSDDRGASVGDPHVTTFDGLHYDLQVVGEFTLVRSTKDDFTVQIRQVPALGSKEVSVNRAMATKLGPDRVSVTMDKGVAVPRINGKIVTGALPALKGGVITRSTNMYGDAYQVTWPDGTTVRAEQSGRSAMNVRVRPAAARRGTLAGLLGDADGAPENDLIGLRNTRLGARPSESDVIHSLADAWRIAQAESLFDYEPGQSTATFADRNFPGKAVDLSKIANRAEAEQYCKEMEITDEHLLADCILDVAVTNDFVFGSEYAHAQQVLAARAAVTGSTKAPSETLPTLIMTGEIRTDGTGANLDRTSQVPFQFNAKKDDVIWVHDPDCTDKLPQFHSVGLTLLDPEGKPVGGFGQACDFGRRELPATGTYTFKTGFGYQNETVKYRVPIRFVRPNRRLPLAYGQTVSGNIEQRAAHDVYTWTGQAGDVIKLSGAGCDLGSMATGIIDPAGHDSLGPGCRASDAYKLTERGTYQLIINSLDFGPLPTTTVGPGAYHFVFQGGPAR